MRFSSWLAGIGSLGESRSKFDFNPILRYELGRAAVSVRGIVRNRSSNCRVFLSSEKGLLKNEKLFFPLAFFPLAVGNSDTHIEYGLSSRYDKLPSLNINISIQSDQGFQPRP